ncbi:MAG: hypothetical protein JSW05_02450 [Candidatus Thorarchaeota archaeon]|nr:MAG: hypothetical protein JSW05_02450 [Candidatus Thorarchaeota archaeon]
MNSGQETKRVYIDCYDALGFYEENYERIVLVMRALAESHPKEREWVSAQAVGGRWARSIRCLFETEQDSHNIKKLMLGIEYCAKSELPDSLQKHTESEIFRFADFDVIEAGSVNAGAVRRLAGKIAGKKIGIGSLRESGSDAELILSCRKQLLDALDSTSKKKLIELENKIFIELENTRPA